jgi:hypothetical protein
VTIYGGQVSGPKSSIDNKKKIAYETRRLSEGN